MKKSIMFFVMSGYHLQTSYPFPLVNGRKFLLDWMNLFPWLTYSPKVDGAFCINCVLFGAECMATHNASKLQRLFKSPFTTWQVRPAKFREHCEKSPIHQAATARAAVLRSHMEQKSAPIDVMLDDMKRQQIEENRKAHHWSDRSLWKAKYSPTWT